MGASRGGTIGGALLALSLLGPAAHAFEPDQPGGPARPDATRPLPAFLDGQRLPDFQDAWHSGPTKPESASPALDEEAAAREAMKRAEQASRDAAAVRRRAEELSRLFGAGGAGEPAAPEEAPEAPTTAAIPGSAAKDAAPARQPSGTARRDNAGVPPLPTRAPKAAMRSSAPRGYRAVGRSRSAPLPPHLDPARAEVFPNYIRAFGWDSQPK